MHARIYRPTKTAMQSGTGNTQQWVLEFEPESKKTIDPLMGWTGSDDTRRQVKLAFETREEAEAYAERYGIAYEVLATHKRKRIIQSYADNFK